MGGFIGVESNIGEGTEIQFVIPQKIEDEIPIASCPKAKEHHVLIYMTMRQFDIQSVRNDYNRMIRHMLSQFQVDSHLCSNIDELKRRISLDTATHVFVGIMEYMEDKDLCLRSWKIGCPVIYYPQSRMIHNHLRASSKIGKKMFIHIRSLITFFKKHGLSPKR